MRPIPHSVIRGRHPLAGRQSQTRDRAVWSFSLFLAMLPRWMRSEQEPVPNSFEVFPAVALGRQLLIFFPLVFQPLTCF